MKIAGIPRNPVNSPNMSLKDMSLFNEIITRLKSNGHIVDILDEKENIAQDYDAIFHMSRTTKTLKQLAACEAKGIYVINPANGVLNCSREKVIDILDKNQIQQPLHVKITSNTNISMLKLPGWLKKGEGWSCCTDDVIHVTTKDEVLKGISSFLKRGCKNIIYSEHITGDLIKFYGIRKNSFFKWHYPEINSTKFGLEKINGLPQKLNFDENKLQKIAFKAAEALNIYIFGGDCIVTNNGEIYIIDINDFPSFSKYRNDAAKSIVLSIQKNNRI